ncbi:hypothetical protein [Corynebacterium sp. UMB2355A]|uniref:hypothetical protein n=1 Tax=Corynebacterium sp. UMB2355A TaxID=3081222 RepID=UPI0029FF2CA8|nr:hypothetical protein [Corynebacterium sp. UMB2355A]WPJ91971.1 hypothetical protein R0V12_06605 [Corynebacterium sp. UMB2355A]
MHKLTSGALVVALTGTAVTVPATINPTAHYAEAQGLLGLGGQALQGLVEKGEAKVAELESQLWKADLALKGAQAVLEMKRWGVVLAIGEENKKAKQAEYDQQKLLVDSAELLVRTTKTSLDAARKTLAVTKKQLEDFNGKDPSAYEDAPEPDIKPVALPTNLREALESITAQQEAVAKRQALFDEADSAYTKHKKEVDSSWFSWLAPSNTKELEGLKNRRDARKAKLDLEQARLDNITRSIELFEAIEAETPAHDGHGADRYDATTPTNVDDASRQLEFANSTLEAATHRKANIEANLAALTGWQERNPFTGFWHNADKWTLEHALRAADNEIADATKRIADKAAALEELKNAPAETEASAPEVETPSEVVEPSATVEPSAAAEPTEDSAPRTPEPSAPEVAPEPSESEAPTAPESPATSSEESAPRTPETTEPTTDVSTATSTPATTSTSTPEDSAPRTPEASESVEPADTSAEPEDQIDIDELTHNLDEAKKLEQDMLDLQKLLQQYINKPEAETTEPSETEVTPTTVTEVSAATSAPATTSVPTSEVSAARTTETTEPATEDSAARTTEETAPTADSSAARTTPTEIPSSEQSAPRTTTSAKLSTVAVAPATSSEVSAARTTEAAEPTTEVSAATSTPATTSVPTSEVSAARTTETTEPATEDSAARTTPTEIPSSEQSAPRTTTSAKLSTVAVAPATSSEVSAARTTEAAEPTTEVSATTSTPATTSAPASSEVSAARTTPTEIPSSQQSAPQTTEAAKPTTEVSAATSTPATRPGSSAPRTTSQAPETTQQAKPTQQTEGAASGAEGSSASSWLWLILPLLLALGFGGAAYADLIPGVRLPRM